MIFPRANVRRRMRQRSAFESLEPRNLLAGDPILDGQPLIISEFVADSNASLLTRTRANPQAGFDGPAESPDWIEILNVSDRSLDIGGMHLTDDAGDPTKWSFPSGTSIEVGEFAVVFASGDDIADPSLDENGYLHTNFRLSGEGEYLALTDAGGQIIHEFAPTFPVQRTDVSHAAPMEVRELIGEGAVVEYQVPQSDSLEPQWRSVGYENADLVVDGASPLGYDVGGGPAEPGQTIGPDAIDRSSIDFARGTVVVLEGSPFTESGRVAEWSFFSDKTRTLTPLIFRASEGEFEIVGVGQTRSSDGSGTQTFAFERQSGSDVVEPSGYFFGYKDGDNEADESGVVVFARSETDLIRRYNGPLSGSMVVGQVLSGGRQFDRAYSIQATTQASLAGPIQTDVAAEMTMASSAYVRYPFEVDQVDALQRLSLNVRYEDGFVAYLNGTEVARRNVPDTTVFDSLANSNRPLAEANRFEEINISNFISQLSVGENVLAVHVFNDQSGGPDFLIDARLTAVYIPTVADYGFADEPTPGRTNGAVLGGFAQEPVFSHQRGFYETHNILTLSTPETPGAAIYLTSDGSHPGPENANAFLYQEPIDLIGSRILRAASYLDGMLPSQVVTHSFFYTDDVVTQETLQPAVVGDPVWGPQMQDSLKALPTLSIVTEESIQVEGEFATSAELIFPDGTPGFHVNAGIEVFGGTAVSFPKRSLRLSFKNIYGPSTFVHDVFDDPDGVQEFDQLILRPGSHDTPFWDGAVGVGNYIRNRWTNDRQLDQGHPAPRGRFVQLYLNGVYWGQYQLLERANAAFMAANFGGDKSDYDVLNAGAAIDGDEVAWNALLDSLDDGYDAVKSYLDVVNYADYILLQFFGGNTVDWRSESNWMAARRREPGAGFQFFAWDSDIVLRTGADSDIVNFGGPGYLATRSGGIYQYPEFRRLLAERAQLYFFDDGLFTNGQLREQVDAFIDELQVSVIAETARWGSGRYTPDTWLSAMQWMKDTYAPVDGPSRADTVIEQMRHAGLFPLSDRPDFLVNGQPLDSTLAEGDELSMTTSQGAIYYTLDGSDPWQDHPTQSYTALVDESSQARVIVPADGAMRQDWLLADFDDSAWIVGQNGVGFDTTGELTPFVALDIEQEMKDVNATAYMRFPFHVDDPSSFDSLEFSVRYDDAFVAYLNGVEVARRNAPASVGWNSNARWAHANIEAIEFETFNLGRELSLLTAGDNVLAIHALNSEAGNVDMLMTPRLRAGVVTNTGATPAAIQYAGPIRVPADAQIKARALWGDQWSTLIEASVDSEPFPLRISEVMYHPADPTDAEVAAGFDDDNDFEFIELVNVSDTLVDLTNVRLAQTTVGGQSEGVELEFGRAAIRQLAPGERLLVVEDQEAFAFRYGNQLPVAGQWVGGLNNQSEQITLVVGDAILQQFTYDDQWYLETDGGGSSLEIVNELAADLTSWNDRSAWQPSLAAGGSPGRAAGPENRAGDSNGDGRFDSDDLLFVLAAGEFEDGIAGNSTFLEGDWNGDGDFDSADLVYVFKLGSYDAAANPRQEVSLASRDLLFARLADSDVDEDEKKSELLDELSL